MRIRYVSLPQKVKQELCTVNKHLAKRGRSMMLLHQNVISDCVEIIRNEISNFKNPFPSCPTTQNELLTCNESIPPYLEKLLLGIISSNTEKSEWKLRIVSFIGQGLIYNAIWGEKKTLKHVQLGVSIKRKTGSRKAIQWLNRFGHGLAYKEISHVEKFLVEEQVNDNQRNFVPINIQPGTMVTFVYDNCVIIWSLFEVPLCTQSVAS